MSDIQPFMDKMAVATLTNSVIASMGQLSRFFGRAAVIYDRALKVFLVYPVVPPEACGFGVPK